MLIQWSDEDKAFIVTLPEFDGCKTHGDTYEEAVKNGRDVIQLLIETYGDEKRPLPRPALFETATA
jgi:predicted RNase H-like HicB family nuclease